MLYFKIKIVISLVFDGSLIKKD